MSELDRLVSRIGEALHQAGVPHAFGGAIALAFWAPPRATADIDLNVFVSEDRLDAVFDAIQTAGFEVDRVRARISAVDRGDFRAWCEAVRLDVFVPFSPFHDEVARRVVTRPLDPAAPIRVLSAEDLLLFKVLFDRPKDWFDVERLAAQQGPCLDAAYVRHWLRELLPEKDARLDRIERFLAAR